MLQSTITDDGLTFRTAANNGDLATLKILYEANKDLLDSSGSKSGQTALHRAVEKGHVAVIQWLIDQGADIHKPDSKQQTPYNMGLASHDSQVSAIFLTASIAKLDIKDADPDALLASELSEGAVPSTGLAISEKIQDHWNASIAKAAQYWAKVPFANQPTMSMAFVSLKQRLGEYLTSNERADLKATSEMRKHLNSLLLHMIITLHGIEVPKNVDNDQQKQSVFSDLCFLHALIGYESAAHHCLNGSNHTNAQLEQICKDLYLCLSNFKRADHYDQDLQNKELVQDYLALKKALYKNIYIAQCCYNPSYMGFKELQYHANRKNDLATARNEAYHCEIVFNDDVQGCSDVDQTTLDRLVQSIVQIKRGEKPRTQFIVDVLGQGHAMLVDVDYSKQSQKFELVCVEPAALSLQPIFLLRLMAELMVKTSTRTDCIAIQSSLLSDFYSCYAFCLAISSQLSKLSFEALQKTPTIEQPDFTDGQGIIRHEAAPDVVWKDVTALGKKVVMMAQSTRLMNVNLRKIMPSDTDVPSMIKQHLAQYHLDDRYFVPLDRDCHRSYIHARRHFWRQKLMQNPFRDLNVQAVLNKLDSTSVGQAIRRLATGHGPKRELAFLLEQHPELVDEQSSNGRAALHWAYANNKLSRAQLLLAHGANPDIKDSQSKKPIDLKPNSMI